MAKTIKKLSIVISGTNDLASERKVIDGAIAECSKLLEETHSVQLKTIWWEEDVLPGIGSDVQAVINSQIGQDFDVYIGVLGTRFGTPTQRAGSGTQEEFRAAYERYCAEPSSLRILFYFKEAADNLHDLDLTQLQQVIEFRQRMQGAGVLVFGFSNSDVLYKLVSEHIRRLVIEQWNGDAWKVLCPPPQASRFSDTSQIDESTVQDESESITAQDSTDEEPSEILDAIVSGNDAFQSALETINRIGELNTKLNDGMLSKAALLPAVAKDVRAFKKVVDSAADDFADYATGLQRELAVLKAALDEGLSSLELAITLYFAHNFGDSSQLAGSPANLLELINGMAAGRASVDQMQTTIAGLQPFTARFKKSKNRAAQILAQLSATLTVFLQKADAIRSDLMRHMTPESHSEVS
jgi:Domain of unknown function (DUF4062)